MEKDAIIAVLGAAVSLAGIVLAFIGLVLAQAENFQNVKRKEAFKRVGKVALVPFLLSLFAAWFSLSWLGRNDIHSYAIWRVPSRRKKG